VFDYHEIHSGGQKHHQLQDLSRFLIAFLVLNRSQTIEKTHEAVVGTQWRFGTNSGKRSRSYFKN
jgi:hypothetical protein